MSNDLITFVRFIADTAVEELPPPNYRAARDAALALCLGMGCHWCGASEHGGYDAERNV